ncbi:hypothetical protein EJ03DRAFT_277287 [Teratosphaeria nubilosa]|uniref:Tat pathway signal sequence n=1 Tax=Teratosphaeria nubilosa TaxID=161662 RepID=A0A6G1L341_9PEZI|nr:hypothetical protein EJ03DRAFT_277287 [Teratosphaeria nubilosa]
MEKDVFLGPDIRFVSKRRQSLWSWFVRAGLAVACVAIYTIMIVSTTWSMAVHKSVEFRRHGTRFLPSPANDYIVYEPQVMEQWEDESAPKYFGEPNEDIDRNWHELFEPLDQNLGLSPALMRELGREDEGIRLPDGTYYGSIMVFHHLHCLKNIQHSLHPEYYELDHLNEQELAMHWEHTDHCLHMLMDAIMCQGDTTLITMYWQDSMFRPAGNMTSPHECVNWDRLMEWVIPNSRDLYGDDVLVHPKHGPLFSGGKPSKKLLEAIQQSGFGKVGLVSKAGKLI